MGKLTYKQRKKLPKSAFVFPNRGRDGYPIHDRAHAKNALARVSRFGTDYEKQKVRSAVHKRYPDLPGDWRRKSTRKRRRKTRRKRKR